MIEFSKAHRQKGRKSTLNAQTDEIDILTLLVALKSFHSLFKSASLAILTIRNEKNSYIADVVRK